MTSFGSATCPVCHNSFDRQVPHQIYDRFICSRKASRARWKARSHTGEPATQTPAHVASTVNPTDDVLILHAINFQREPNAKPIIFSGDFNRTWTPPAGIMFVEDTSGGMIMGHEEAFNPQTKIVGAALDLYRHPFWEKKKTGGRETALEEPGDELANTRGGTDGAYIGA